MPEQARRPRNDIDQKRVETEQEPERILLYIPGYGIGPKISRALHNDLKVAKKKNPKATISTVLIDWISDHLGLKP